jgi:hypothetical protein
MGIEATAREKRKKKNDGKTPVTYTFAFAVYGSVALIPTDLPFASQSKHKAAVFVFSGQLP